jgi:hypothetical protein
MIFIISFPILEMYLKEYFESIKKYFVEKNGLCLVYMNSYDEINLESNNTYVFVQNIPSMSVLKRIKEIQSKVILLNTEQTSLLLSEKESSLWQYKTLCNVKTCIDELYVDEVWDYSIINHHRLDPKHYTKWKIIPNLFLETLQYPLHNKDIDVSFVGYVSTRRKEELDKIQEIQNVNIIEVYGNERDLLLSRTKIIVNIHCSPNYKIFEELRCSPAIFNKIIVISEESEIDPNHPLNPYVIFETIENLPKRVLHVVENYDTIFREIYNDFNPFDLNMKLKTYSTTYSN